MSGWANATTTRQGGGAGGAGHEGRHRDGEEEQGQGDEHAELHPRFLFASRGRPGSGRPRWADEGSRSAGEGGLGDDDGVVDRVRLGLGLGLGVDDGRGRRRGEVAGALEAATTAAAVGALGRVGDVTGARHARRHGGGDGDVAGHGEGGDGDGAGDAGRDLHGGSSWVVTDPGGRFGRPDPRARPRLRAPRAGVTSATSGCETGRRVSARRRRGQAPGVTAIDASVRRGAWTTMSTAWTAPQTGIPRAEDAALVLAARAGDADAFGTLYEQWFARVYDLAFRITHDEQAAGDVVPDAFLAAWHTLDGLEDPTAFGGWLLRITRNRAFNQGRRDRAAASGRRRDDGDDRAHPGGGPRRAGRRTRAAAERRGTGRAGVGVGRRPRRTRRRGARPLVAPRSHAGRGRRGDRHQPQRGQPDGAPRTRVRLGDAIRARVLWRGGEPQCGDLADALHGHAHVVRFDADAVRVTTAHADGCATCEERRRLRLDPAALFAAVPIMTVPSLLKAKVAHTLSGEGVPMGRAAAGTGGGTPTPGRRHRLRRVVALVAAAVVLVVVGVLVAAESVDDDPAPSARLDDVRVSTTIAPSTAPSTGPPATSPVVAPTTEPAADAPATSVAPPVEPPTTAPPAPPSVQVRVSVAPASAPMTYLRTTAPVLTWATTTGAASVEVSGPGVASSDATGSVPVCPTASSSTWSVCVNPPGPVTYTITARDAAGAVIRDLLGHPHDRLIHPAA